VARPSLSKKQVEPGNVVELFAGVGGFRLGLEKSGAWAVHWSNQWEPGSSKQEASSCYEANFGSSGHVCEDISRYLDWALDGDETAIAEAKKVPLPAEIDLLVGGFPCQDYSVAKSLKHSDGLAGKKGVLWWDINRILEARRPRYVLLENVDRLLKSPSKQRGRDFAVMLSCFSRLGYVVQWRVLNAADYGFPQRRRRVFVLAELLPNAVVNADFARTTLLATGVLARAYKVSSKDDLQEVTVSSNPVKTSTSFNSSGTLAPWGNAGLLVGDTAYTLNVSPTYAGKIKTLRDVLFKGKVSKDFYLEDTSLETWEYLKGAKKAPRVDKQTGHEYLYSEGPVAFPDSLDKPSRTILTSEGGSAPSRSKHVVRKRGGRLRRLLPVELERLQGFPDDWTKYDAHGREIPATKRAFFMGNALVVGVVQKIGKELARRRNDGSSLL